MDIFAAIKLFGGLALFLYGMSTLGSGLERASGGRLENTLEKLTDTVVKGVLLGALVTAAIQSSSATTVIVVGLVNARVLKLRNAIGVIMGANIGTTITAHILRLSDLQSDHFLLLLLKPTALAPLAAIVGIIMLMGGKREKPRIIGQVLLSFSILFTGMFAMEAAVAPLRDNPAFAKMFATFANPIIGVMVGTLVTVIIQSSSASVGILQALSSTGFITYSTAFPIIMGQNIGTCITPILASIGASKNAKRTAAVHVCFNVIGTLIFLIICYSYQYLIGFSFWETPIDRGGIANFHTIFNVCTTLLFIPMAGLLERLACTIVKDKPGDRDRDPEAVTLDERLLVSPGLAIQHVRKAVAQMAGFARENLRMSQELLFEFDQKVFERINENEDVVDKLQDRVEIYLLKMSERELGDADSRSVTELLHACEAFERIADHAQNVAESAQQLYQNKTTFSKRACEEIRVICEAVGEISNMAADCFEHNNMQIALRVEPLEQVIDDLEKALKDKHIDRLRKGKCTVDAAFPFVETLTDLERIADHCSNIALSVLTFNTEDNLFDKHDYVKRLRESNPESYQQAYRSYEEKYYKLIRPEKMEKAEKEKIKVAKTEKAKK